MRSLTIALAVLFGLSGSAQQSVPASTGTFVESKIPAATLKGNLLGDPAEARVAVYLPPSYASSPQRRYPTVYLLHGYTGDVESFTRFFFPKVGFAKAIDEAIKRGASREMIVVVPSGRNRYFGSFYVNSPVTGAWEDLFAGDLVTWVDKTYRTIPSAESRGIAGHSMGGYGAIMLAMKHPDVFSAVYALSPCCVALEADLGPDNPAWNKALQIQSPDQLKAEPASLEDFYSTAFVALAAALSPNPSKAPLYVDLPFKRQGRSLVPNEEAYAKWRAQLPLYLVESHRRNLEKLKGIHLEYGALEEFAHIRSATRALSAELAARGIGHTFEVYEGGDHMNMIAERIETRVLRFFTDVLSADHGSSR